MWLMIQLFRSVSLSQELKMHSLISRKVCDEKAFSLIAAHVS